MTILTWIFLATTVIFGLSLAATILVIRGMLKTEKSNIENYKRKILSGVETEEIRRRVIEYGMSKITINDVLNLIYTKRAIEVGAYEDIDPYVPADPYDGIEEEI